MRLSGLYVYPVKSTAPLALDEAVVEPRGLANDRRWMVVDADGRFMTGRQLPRMTLIRARPTPAGLDLEAPGMEPLRVSRPAADWPAVVTVWKSTVHARPCAPEVDAWLTRFLGRPARLVHMHAAARRDVDAKYAQPGDEVSFADGFPMLAITQAALDGLNARLERPVSMLQFRPNLVIADAPAHAEDGWTRIRVGGVEFDVVKPCVRCVFTTVDPERGERDADGEPLRTLTAYRRTEKGVTFGQNLIPRSRGTIRLDDPVEVLA